MKIIIEVSARHIHIEKNHVERLFGKGHKLTPIKDLSQPGQFAAKETVTLSGPKGEMKNVRILGPERNQTQVEISETDCFKLGIKPAVRLSGDLLGTSGVVMKGPLGEVELKEGVIVAERHVHMSQKDADKIKVKNGDRVMVDIDGIRDLLYENIPVRVSEKFETRLHLDTDEANAAFIQSGDTGELIINQKKWTGK